MSAGSPALVLATNNDHKLREILEILGPLLPGSDLSRIVTMAEFNVPSPVEDALTFEGNAVLKARAVAEATGLPALADDSGLVVDVMGGAPGIFSARWSGKHGDDRANLNLLLNQIADLKDEDRGAQFVCCAALALPEGSVTTAEGIMRGSMARKVTGRNGFGYDPAFIPEGMTVSSAELTPDQKNAISHRAKAMAAMAPKIAESLS